MMKQVVSIFLSLIILVSSTGLTFTTHFCMGHAVTSEVMLGKGTLECGMNGMDTACDLPKDTFAFMLPTCCDTEYISVDICDKYEKSNENISFEQQFMFSFVYTLAFIDNHDTSEQLTVYSHQYPPPLDQDYQSLYQSFLL